MPNQPRAVRRILVTGSMDGLGRGAAEALLDQGHEVVVHARSAQRAASAPGLTGRAAGVVLGDLASGAETRVAADPAFQSAVLAELERLTGTALA